MKHVPMSKAGHLVDVFVNCIYRMNLKNYKGEKVLVTMFRGIIVSKGKITLEAWNNLIIFGFHKSVFSPQSKSK